MVRSRASIGTSLFVVAAAAAFFGFGSPGCGGGGGGGGALGDGDIGITFTDGPADDVTTFDVEVLDVTLTRSDGLVVDALPAKQRLDFASLVGLSELVTAAEAPAGVYTGVSLTLNLVNAPGTNPAAATTSPDGVIAQVLTATSRARVVDASGNEFTAPVTLPVQLDPRVPLIVIPGSPRLLEIDFALDDSLDVDVASNTIKVLPILKAEVEPRRLKTIRVRGPLLGVNVGAGAFGIALRPRPNLVPFGSIRVDVTPGTFFDVNGTTSFGLAGLIDLDAQPNLTAVVVHGIFVPAQQRFFATVVEAGSSVPGGTLDIVEGVVTARSGDVLTVRGLTLERSTGVVAYNRVITVTTSPSSIIVKRFLQGTLAVADVGVGQNVIAAGDLAGSTLGSVQTPVPFVRLIPTAITGTLDAPVANGALELNVQRIGRLPFSAFPNAPPSPWTVALGSLQVPSPAGAPLFITGFVQTTGAEFAASSVIDVTDFSLAFAAWDPKPVANPITAATASGLTVDLTGAGLRFTVTGADPAVLLPAGPIAIRKSASSQGLFVTRVFAGPTLVFTDFGDWTADLATRAAAGARPRRLAAVGRLNGARTEIDSDAAAVTME